MSFPVVRIIWIDAVATNSWKTVPELKAEEHEDTEPCTTIGFLVLKNKQYYYVASTVSNVVKGEPVVNNIMMIPRKWVKAFEEIDLGASD